MHELSMISRRCIPTEEPTLRDMVTLKCERVPDHFNGPHRP